MILTFIAIGLIILGVILLVIDINYTWCIGSPCRLICDVDNWINSHCQSLRSR